MPLYGSRYRIVPVGQMLPPMIFAVYIAISLRYLGYGMELAIISIDVTEALKEGGFSESEVDIYSSVPRVSCLLGHMSHTKHKIRIV